VSNATATTPRTTTTIIMEARIRGLTFRVVGGPAYVGGRVTAAVGFGLGGISGWTEPQALQNRACSSSC
jgi:hypothetical protein